MKHFFLSLFFGLLMFQTQSINAQTFQKKSLKAGQNWSDYITYLFPSFNEGVVNFKAGGTSKSKMNFNMLFCQLQFISTNGDTLLLANPETIESVKLNDRIFYYDKGYYEVLDDFDSIKLVVLRTAKIQAVKVGAMGIENHNTAVDSYSRLLDQQINEARTLSINEDLDITNTSTYYLVQKNGEKLVANKSNYLRLFETKKKPLEDYLKSNKVSFSKEVDLKNLTGFCVKQ